MLLTVTLNPAWDVTYEVDELHPGQSHRVHSAAGQAGGKGINVSRVLHQMGVATVATGVVGGTAGDGLEAELSWAGMRHAFVYGEGETRTTVSITDSRGTATVFNEPGPAEGGDVWLDLLDRVETLLVGADAMVLAGSLPPWAPPDAYGQLTDLAHRSHCPALVDADGPALAAALGAHPDLVKPNRAELRRATGREQLEVGVAAAFTAGARRMVVTDGPNGIYGFDQAAAWHARPPVLSPVNPTGAGDAALAALAVGLARDEPWPDLLRRAVAWSAAAVLLPRAGQLRTDSLPGLERATVIQRIAHPRRPAHDCLSPTAPSGPVDQ